MAQITSATPTGTATVLLQGRSVAGSPALASGSCADVSSDDVVDCNDPLTVLSDFSYVTGPGWPRDVTGSVITGHPGAVNVDDLLAVLKQMGGSCTAGTAELVLTGDWTATAIWSW